MSLKCGLGFHTWEHCRCTACGKQRSAQHLIDESTCRCCFCDAYEHKHVPFRCLVCDDKAEVLYKQFHVLASLNKDIALFGTMACYPCTEAPPDYGPFKCVRCGRPADVEQIGAYVWEVALCGTFALAVSRTTFAEACKRDRKPDYERTHTVLRMRLHSLVHRTMFAAQELAGADPAAGGLKGLAAACKSAQGKMKDRVEYALWGHEAAQGIDDNHRYGCEDTQGLDGLVSATWEHDKHAQPTEVGEYAAKNFGWCGKGTALTRDRALALTTRIKSNNPELEGLADIEKRLKGTAQFDFVSIGLDLGPILHFCVPSTLRGV